MVELKQRIRAAIRLQSIGRSVMARRTLRSKLSEKRFALFSAASKSVADRSARRIQGWIRSCADEAIILHHQYSERQRWYDDSRVAALLQPFAKVIATLRLQMRAVARATRHQLETSIDKSIPVEHGTATFDF